MSSSPRHHDPPEDDEDSLFGSPPPSPGRSPSPDLALPGSRSNASGNIISALNKNVGTIALPGSQPNSELFLNPLASSLSLPSDPRHPAPAPRGHYSHRFQRGPTTFSPAAPSESPPPAQLKPQKQRKRMKRPTEPTFTPEVLQIPDLDPTAPPPTNFLRSQSALLGAAGLVAGVKPANLIHRGRGATPSNPIVIDEGEIEHKPPASSSHIQKGTQTVDSGRLNQLPLTMPSKQEILAALAKERDVFPIIQSLIKLTAPGGARPQELQPSSSRSANAKDGPRTAIIGIHATGFPMKKRKLNRVPAGAADWDIPYPFANGEGPEEYSETWRSERSKQLISQLINLIKSATKKAAILKYMKNKPHREGKVDNKRKAKEDPNKRFEKGPRVNKYYKPITATYGLPLSCVSSRQSTPAHDHGPSANPSRSVTPSSVSVPPSSSVATTPGPEQAQESNSLDQLLSTLLAMTQAQNFALPSQSIAATPSTSTSGDGSSELLDPGLDERWLGDWMDVLDPSVNMNADGCLPVGFTFTTMDSPHFDSATTSSSSTTVNPFSMSLPLSSTDDIPIDPVLLGLGDVSSAPPTMPTASATSAIDPTTPASVNWDLEMPDLFSTNLSGGQGMGPPAEQGGERSWGDITGKTRSLEKPQPVPETPLEEGSFVWVSAAPSISDPLETAKPSLSTEKEDIIRRVKERKGLLEVGLNKVKLHLWETTIEQGALHHVLGHYQEQVQISISNALS